MRVSTTWFTSTAGGLSALALGAALTLAAPSAAWAQGMGAGNPGAAGHMAAGPGGKDKPELPAPDAVPGAKAKAPAAPATRSAADMQPNDALFDAINRGDIAAARDALNRGADLHAVNILGMTPMELSVDLGRNDISFLLLSMRGEDSDRGSQAVGREPPPASAAKTVPGKRVAQAKPATAKAVPVATKAIATPKLFANDGGTPLPSAGFLGFDSRSATN